MPDSELTIGPPDLSWTPTLLKIHFDALAAVNEQLLRERTRRYEERHLADQRFSAERDRRYAENNIERERALKIKETADRDALQLARDIQTYKDQAHNGLLDQLTRERVLYASKGDLVAAVEKIEATIGPVLTFVASQQGRNSGFQATGALIAGSIAAIAAIVSIIGVILVLVLR